MRSLIWASPLVHGILGYRLKHNRIDHSVPARGHEDRVECVVVANDLEVSNAAEFGGPELDAHHEIVGELGMIVAD